MMTSSISQHFYRLSNNTILLHCNWCTLDIIDRYIKFVQRYSYHRASCISVCPLLSVVWRHAFVAAGFLNLFLFKLQVWLVSWRVVSSSDYLKSFVCRETLIVTLNLSGWSFTNELSFESVVHDTWRCDCIVIFGVDFIVRIASSVCGRTAFVGILNEDRPSDPVRLVEYTERLGNGEGLGPAYR